MKYRKVGVRMCIISIIMITLCIPNQIQIANAEENEPDIKVVDQYQEEWDTDTKLKIFPRNSGDNTAKINPGGSGEYQFTVSNQSAFDITYELTVSEDVSGLNYPIEYMLEDSDENQLMDWQRLKTKMTYNTRLNKGTREELVLKWRFIDTGEDVTEGTYTVRLKVNASQVTGSDNNSSNNNQGNNTTNDGTNGNDSSNNNQGNNQNNSNNLNIDKTSSKETRSTETNRRKVNTSDITTPVIYVALMILTFGLILLVKSRKEN